MGKERYVTFKVAQLLKEKGFDWECLGFFKYYKSSPHAKPRLEMNISIYPSVRENSTAPCPTQQMACDWVEETYGFFIEISRSIDLNGDYLYRYAILDKRNFVSKLNHIYKSKEDAVEAALEYVLTDLI